MPEPGFTAFFSPAKLNLFLHVVGRRADGYHELETLFCLLNFGDTIEVAVDDTGIVLQQTLLAGVPPEQDLMVRAARLLQQTLPANRANQLGCRLRITKRIPMGGGLGGGSSNAATVLMALNRLWGLNLSKLELQQLGLGLGADVPIFIFGRPAFAQGVGEKLHAVALPVRYFAVLIPPVSVSTAEIFSDEHLTRDTPPITMCAFLAKQDELNRDDLEVADLFSSGDWCNDLTDVATRKYPIIAAYLAWLSQFGKAMMTGSGACVFVAFKTEADAVAVLQKVPPLLCGLPTNGFVARSLLQHTVEVDDLMQEKL